MGFQSAQGRELWCHLRTDLFACNLDVPQFLEHCGAPAPLVWRDGTIQGDGLHHGVSTGEAELPSAFLLIVTKAKLEIYLSNEKNLGWLGYVGDYTTQLYRDYNKPL